MKKVFLAVLCAGLFFACGNKKAQEPEALMDTVPAQQEEVVQQEPEEVAEPVADEPVAQTTPAKKTTTTPKKNTSSSTPTVSKTNEAPSVQEHAQSAANRVANKAIDKAEAEATSTIVNSGKKKR
ncbi:MAG: hypothetical protein IKZ56_09510 [Bacteroidales bacterium]|nr:hypothetical protein [Bacteroidales bacterium]